MKSNKKFKWLIGIPALIFSLFFAGIKSSEYFEISKNLDIFASVVRELNNYYVDPIKPGELIKNGIDAMLEKLDPYTVYISEAEIEDYKIMTTGHYGGIGSVIQQRDGYIMIVQPYENSPAVKAGLMAGDLIVEVNGISTKGKSIDEVRNILMGQPGTTVTLKVKRPFKEEEFMVDVLREDVKIKDVPYAGMIKNGIGYIKLNSFTETASKELKEAFIELKEKQGMKALVIDLRNNGGGLLREAVAIVNFFIDKGKTVVMTKGKLEEWDKVHKTTSVPLDKDIPLVILVNENSASASEIVAGALQDYDRAVLIGKNTFGKGLVQNIVPLSYNAQLKVTVAKYYIPSGRCIQKIDYSHKDENGEPLPVPDSLKRKFNTLYSKRPVFDGDGITPDIIIEDTKTTPLIVALMQNHVIFDFSTLFRQKNSTIANPSTFEIDEKIYTEFQQFAESKKLQYKSETFEHWEEFKKAAGKENYDKILAEEYKTIESKIKPDIKKDLELSKETIKLLLGSEIVSRYYYQKGEIQFYLHHDPYIDSAVKVLGDPAYYQKILSGM
jgi:carboxyl-terminal processing protease